MGQTQPALIIGVATAADVPAMFDIRTRVRENALTRAQLAELGITEPGITDAVQADDCAFVARMDGRVVGFAMIDAEAASLFALFVDPAREGMGIGRRLLAAAEEALFARADRIQLDTQPGTRADGFYRRCGWQVEAVIDGGDIRMTKHR